MFILYALIAGLLVGAALGGRWLALGSIPFRWAPLIFAGFLSQLILFSDAVAERVGPAGGLAAGSPAIAPGGPTSPSGAGTH